MKRLVIIALVSGVVLVGVGAVAIAFIGLPIEQPIAFNHRLHIQDVGLECTDCHLYAETAARATIPNTEECGVCHDEAQTDSEAELEVVEFVQRGEPIPWRKIYWVEDHVYFSHRRHTAIGGIECATCHGAMEETVAPVTRVAVRISMERCMRCHDESGASNDCVVCHR